MKYHLVVHSYVSTLGDYSITTALHAGNLDNFGYGQPISEQWTLIKCLELTCTEHELISNQQNITRSP